MMTKAQAADLRAPEVEKEMAGTPWGQEHRAMPVAPKGSVSPSGSLAGPAPGPPGTHRGAQSFPFTAKYPGSLAFQVFKTLLMFPLETKQLEIQGSFC